MDNIPDTEEGQEAKLRIESKRWENRRGFAKKSFLVCVLLTFVLVGFVLFGPVAQAEVVVGAFPLWATIYAFFGGIIMTYIGSAAYSDVRLWK